MRYINLLGFAMLLATGLASVTAVAHHSFAMFDHTQTYTLKGTVVSFQWTNPHGYIDLEVQDGPEGIERFSIELTSINMLRRAGWRSSDVKAGDRVTAIVAPLASGALGGLLLELDMEDGRKLMPPVPDVGSFTRTP